MGWIKHYAKRLLRGKYADSESYIKYLRKQGCSIGDGTVIYSPAQACIDLTRPWLVKIGDNVKITRGITILTHGYDWSVLKNVYKEAIGSSGRVTLGNNIFIGMNTTILKGVTIGDNVIIGACSLVNKDLQGDGVYAGNPCRFIMTLADYYEKRKSEYVAEARDLALSYFERYHTSPPISVFYEFFPLFLPRDIRLVKEKGFSFDGHFEEPVVEAFLRSKPQFAGFEDFLSSCGLHE